MNKKYRFKSSTDVNNYNKFLLDLDNKPKPIQSTNNNTIQNCVDSINKEYDETNGFNSLSKLDVLCNAIDPNEYKDIVNIDNKGLEKALKDYLKISGNKFFEPNPLRPEIEPIIKYHVTIDTEINNIEDLLKIIEKYPEIKETKYNINMNINILIIILINININMNIVILQLI